jgi:hypothetical protein
MCRRCWLSRPARSARCEVVGAWERDEHPAAAAARVLSPSLRRKTTSRAEEE